MDENEYIRPPGTYYDILAHPVDSDASIEVAIVQDHRFAFFYWLKWQRKNERTSPPLLLSLDWHQDLVYPCELTCEWLRDLNVTDYKEVAFFCWDKLQDSNDGHILAAAYLNIIGDIHVVQKQERASVEYFQDIAGNTHVINCYESVEALIDNVSSQEHSSVVFDIDLDYFTESTDSNGGGESVKLVSTKDIHSCLSPDGKLMSWIYPRLDGITIATEPEFCGGLVNSNNLLDVVNDAMFDPQLLSSRTRWKHLP